MNRHGPKHVGVPKPDPGSLLPGVDRPLVPRLSGELDGTPVHTGTIPGTGGSALTGGDGPTSVEDRTSVGSTFTRKGGWRYGCKESLSQLSLGSQFFGVPTIARMSV